MSCFSAVQCSKHYTECSSEDLCSSVCSRGVRMRGQWDILKEFVTHMFNFPISYWPHVNLDCLIGLALLNAASQKCFLMSTRKLHCDINVTDVLRSQSDWFGCRFNDVWWYISYFSFFSANPMKKDNNNVFNISILMIQSLIYLILLGHTVSHTVALGEHTHWIFFCLNPTHTTVLLEMLTRAPKSSHQQIYYFVVVWVTFDKKLQLFKGKNPEPPLKICGSVGTSELGSWRATDMMETSESRAKD